MACETHVNIGFIEETHNWKLKSHLFPSKVGGKPSWLSLKPIPNSEDLKCSVCSHSCVFLLQLYAPLENNANSFHRTLFVFVCRNPNCCKAGENGNFVVLRSDLNRKNDFYSYDPPDYNNYKPDEKNPSASDFQPLCIVCGCDGGKCCSKCQAPYCSRSHQLSDWKRHKNLCRTSEAKTSCDAIDDSTVLFPEYGIIIDDDDDDIDDGDDDEDIEDNDEDKRMEEYLKVATNSEFSAQELQQMAFTDDDKEFGNFKKVVERNADQIIRHIRGGKPLWITNKKQLNQTEVPKCQHCGSERIFEFQVMPHLIAELNMDDVKKSIDWGVLVVYTCKKSCTGPGDNYRKEFLYKQDILPRTS